MARIKKSIKIACAHAQIDSLPLTDLERRVAHALVNEFSIYGAEMTDSYIDTRALYGIEQRQLLAAMRRLKRKGVISFETQEHRYTTFHYTLFPKDI